MPKLRYLSEYSQFVYEDIDTFLDACEAKDEEDYAPTFIREEGGKVPAWNNHPGERGVFVVASRWTEDGPMVCYQKVNSMKEREKVRREWRKKARKRWMEIHPGLAGLAWPLGPSSIVPSP